MTRHFLEMDHSENDLQWSIIEKLEQADDMMHKILVREQRWVYRCRTHLVGLNDDVPWHQL